MELQAEVGTSATERSHDASRAFASSDPRAEPAGPDSLSRALGWFSIGLGLAQVVMPTNVARMAGAQPDANTVKLMRALGARELLSGIGILSGKRSDAWVRARVAGDIMDLALLGRLLTGDSSDRGRTAAATLAVAGVTALDLLAARRSRAGTSTTTAMNDQSGEPASVKPGTQTIRRAVTINRSPDEVAAFWKEHFTNNADAIDQHVRFVAAPGGRGTEVHLLRTYEKPGPIASIIAKIRHSDPEQLAFDELFALKQMIETGDIVVSDAWLNGPNSPRPAQPQ